MRPCIRSPVGETTAWCRSPSCPHPCPATSPRFDVLANLLAYAPFGFLAVLAFFPALRGAAAVVAAGLVATALSVSLELLQNYLPTRIASNLDVATNAAGGLLGGTRHF